MGYESFPTIVACKSAILNKSSRTKPQDATKASSSNACLDPSSIGEPALFKLKAEKDPEKLFHIFTRHQ
ncbi:hypothetical protein Cni_G16708 [Canna indica]|uniref:Uncharacterized protein n=1 Tax=Canna indica TaxID=4628 RepID=A0AAQ3KJ37_9LILI|nr:hypothetical protein Cni_G16708 [Canna indica]